jgi:hypothetical protein
MFTSLSPLPAMASIASGEFINAIFAKKIRKHSFLIIENECLGFCSRKLLVLTFGLLFAIDVLLYRTAKPASLNSAYG